MRIYKYRQARQKEHHTKLPRRICQEIMKQLIKHLVPRTLEAMDNQNLLCKLCKFLLHSQNDNNYFKCTQSCEVSFVSFSTIGPILKIKKWLNEFILQFNIQLNTRINSWLRINKLFKKKKTPLTRLGCKYQIGLLSHKRINIKTMSLRIGLIRRLDDIMNYYLQLSTYELLNVNLLHTQIVRIHYKLYHMLTKMILSIY